jgi:hypothetical protein
MIDVRARRAERLLGVLGLCGVVGAGVLLYPPVSTLVASFFIVVTAAVIAGLWLQGWLGGVRRLARIAWLPDGQWQLRDARHTDVVAELRGDSRVGAHWLWLRWNADSAWRRRQPSMLLIRGDIPDGDLRRLIVRLRLDAHSHPRRESAPRPTSAAESPVRDDDF